MMYTICNLYKTIQIVGYCTVSVWRRWQPPSKKIKERKSPLCCYFPKVKTIMLLPEPWVASQECLSAAGRECVLAVLARATTWCREPKAVTESVNNLMSRSLPAQLPGLTTTTLLLPWPQRWPLLDHNLTWHSANTTTVIKAYTAGFIFTTLKTDIRLSY